MSRDRGELRIPFPLISELRADNRKGDMVIGRARSPISMEERRRQLGSWWSKSGMGMILAEKSGIWLTEHGANMDAAAGGRNETVGHEMAELTLDTVIVAKLRSTHARLLGEDLVDKTLMEARRIEAIRRLERDWAVLFTGDFIGWLKQARGYSDRKEQKLREHLKNAA